MATREISREMWLEFLQTFASDHDGELFSLGVTEKQRKRATAESEARKLPLRGIVVDLRDDQKSVVISLGLSSNRMLSHEIKAVSHVRVAQNDDGSVAALLIESSNGHTSTFNLALAES